MAERVQVRDPASFERNKLLGIVRRVRGQWCDGEVPRSCSGPPRPWTCPPSPRSPSPPKTGSERSSATSTLTGSIPWLGSTPVTDHRSSRCRNARRSRRCPVPSAILPPALLDLEPVQAGRVPGRRGGWSTTSVMRAFEFSPERRACRFKQARPGSRAAIRTSRRRRTGSSNSTPSPTARLHRSRTIRRS